MVEAKSEYVPGAAFPLSLDFVRTVISQWLALVF
jgi:hypothetical protein